MWKGLLGTRACPKFWCPEMICCSTITPTANLERSYLLVNMALPLAENSKYFSPPIAFTWGTVDCIFWTWILQRAGNQCKTVHVLLCKLIKEWRPWKYQANFFPTITCVIGKKYLFFWIKQDKNQKLKKTSQHKIIPKSWESSITFIIPFWCNML